MNSVIDPANKRKRLFAVQSLRVVLLFLLLVIMLIDALPSCHRMHDELKDGLDPLLDKTGLWQGEWNLFAPDVDKLNISLIVEFKTAAGGTYTWQSMDPQSMSAVARFRYFRWFEYYDSVRRDYNEEAWRPLIEWLIEQPSVVPLGEKVISVKMWRGWADVSVDTLDAPESFPYDNRYLIFEEKVVW